MASFESSAAARDSMPSGGIERRRAQNRIAQRKFRQKRKLKEGFETALKNPNFTLPMSNSSSGFASNQVDFDIDTSFTIDDSCFNDTHAFSPRPEQDSMLSLSYEELPLSQAVFQGSQQPTEDTSSSVELGTLSSKASHDDVSTLPSYRPVSSRAGGRANSNSSLDDYLTSLHLAASRGHSRILSMLLARGKFCINDKDGEGKTALHHAVIGDHESCVRVLLKHGAKVDVSDELTGWTSLHWAVLNANERILRMLLEDGEGGFDVDAFGVSGWTSLHVAAERGFEMGVELLLQHGADLGFRARRCKYTGHEIGKDVEDMIRAAMKAKAVS